MSLRDFTASKDTNRTGASLKGRKRWALTDRRFNVSPGGEVMTMLDSFRADKNKAFGAKRKWLESFTSSSLQMNQQKVRELWRSQQKARTQMSEDYCTQFSSVFQQWESDMQRSKDQDEKHMALFQHQKMMFEQMRVSQGQRLRTLRQLVDHYVKSMQELQDTHKEQYTTALNELRQEMVLLQKEILMNTQQEELTSIRQALQFMLM
ncbi:synaptonemal complex protein 3-like [Electrophorus electricus]|uniref:synaptonemal complex protein 3-like n=1 Tax=Electrophorus electricus TaxID=8005 RepID=UPI0015CFC237|nr:synaptonemal complex protein 3-like [Electrophorus electricus]